MDITKPLSKRYQQSINLTQNEYDDLVYILKTFLDQIKLSRSTHYNGSKRKLMEKIVNPDLVDPEQEELFERKHSYA